ncbi:MAG: cation:proton antiporter [Anaerolineales bacterium]|nr:cation:proton antiporter [Anaerolineales bacterium]
MVVVLAFALTLLVAVLISARAKVTAISIPVLFVLTGFAIGPGMMNFIDLEPETPGIILFVELALFSVLLVDGLHIGLDKVKEVWQLPSRVLIIGLPLTIGVTAVLGHFILNLSWVQALLIAAILSPTDPVFASAIVNRQEVPASLRRLLNLESGLNDGLALPIVLTLLAVVGVEAFQLPHWLLEVGWGVGLGVLLPWVILRLEGSRIFKSSHIYTPILLITIGLLLYSIGRMSNANLFLAAFAAGITIATLNDQLRQAFKPLGEVVAELLKLAALLVFGALLSVHFLEDLTWLEVIFAFSVLLLARPLAVILALRGTRFRTSEYLAAAWFGPRGFASVVYGLYLFTSGVPDAGVLFHIISTVIIISIVAHSSTDVLIVQWFSRQNKQSEREEKVPQEKRPKSEKTQTPGEKEHKPA